MGTSDILAIIFSTVTCIAAVASIVISVLTLRQNNKSIMAANRPYIYVTLEGVNYQTPRIFLLLKNYGKSGAIMKRVTFDQDLTDFTYSKKFTPFKYVENMNYAPNQEVRCSLDSKPLLNCNINFITGTIEYSDGGKKLFKESFSINVQSVFKNIDAKDNPKKDDLTTISYSLQEMASRR